MHLCSFWNAADKTCHVTKRAVWRRVTKRAVWQTVPQQSLLAPLCCCFFRCLLHASGLTSVPALLLLLLLLLLLHFLLLFFITSNFRQSSRPWLEVWLEVAAFSSARWLARLPKSTTQTPSAGTEITNKVTVGRKWRGKWVTYIHVYYKQSEGLGGVVWVYKIGLKWPVIAIAITRKPQSLCVSERDREVELEL